MMTWWLTLLVLGGLLAALFAVGLPVALAFLGVNTALLGGTLSQATATSCQPSTSSASPCQKTSVLPRAY